MNSSISERGALVAVLDPAAHGSESHPTGAVDMFLPNRVLFLVSVGFMNTGSTVTFKLQERDTSSGTYTGIAGKSVSFAKALSDDRKQSLIEVTGDELSKGKR